MHATRRFLLLACTAMSTSAALPTFSQELAPEASTVFQQRAADGSIVLTDRPIGGKPVERTWQVEHEDRSTARARSEQNRIDARAVSERIQRRIEQDRRSAVEAELARLRLALAAADRRASAGPDDSSPVLGYAPWAIGEPGYGGQAPRHRGRPTPHRSSGGPLQRD